MAKHCMAAHEAFFIPDQAIQITVHDPAALCQEIKRLRSIIHGVQGALADAGSVLALREDDDYAASIRTLTAQRDDAILKLAASQPKTPI